MAIESKLQGLDRLHAFQLADRPEHGLGHGRIDREQQYGLAARRIAATAQMEGADIDARFTECRTDAADEARLILIDDIQHITLEIGLDLDAEHFDQSRTG